VESDLPAVAPLLGIDEKRRWLWNGLVALDLSGDLRKRARVVGWFGLGTHPDVVKEQDNHSGKTPSLLGYSVGFCDRFGGATSAMAVNPLTGTLYVADTPRYRVLCYQPKFSFRREPIVMVNGRTACEISGDGGLAPLRFSIAGGQLPAGLSLDAETGLLRGTPRDRAVEYDLEVSVTTATETTSGKIRLILRDEPPSAPAARSQ
jgi:hypothetical protein